MLNVVGFRAFGSGTFVVDVASLRFLLLKSAAVSFVRNLGQVTRVKYQSAIPKHVVASLRSLSDESVCIWSFAKACHVPKIKSIERTVVLCGSGMSGPLWPELITTPDERLSTVCVSQYQATD